MQNWNRESLHRFVSDSMQGCKLIVVSNREPYTHTKQDGLVRCQMPASGLTSAIDPILRASGGTWVAHGSGNADREVVDARDRVRVPPERPAYHLRRVWLPEQIEQEYYCGLSNEGLWPLCHAAFHQPEFSLKHWQSYRTANQIFADAVLEEADGNPAFVFVQDYHLALLPRMLKRSNPNLTIAHFWHIPWPHRETFRAFPWKEEILDGMLGNDLMGFHTDQFCSNFLENVECNVDSAVDIRTGHVIRGGHVTTVRAFPISIDYEEQSATAASAVSMALETAKWRREIGPTPEILGIGIDRVDYTKGIPHRLHAIDRVLSEHPEYVGRLVFLQVGVPSRTAICGYDALNQELIQLVDTINSKWRQGAWRPITFVRRHIESPALTALHLMADFCVVSSLDDGMNLVAKEFVGSRIDGDGVLLLSRFTGAAFELSDALIVNPFAIDEMAELIASAIEMPAVERRRRMNSMRAAVASNTVYDWAGGILKTMAEIGSREASAVPARSALALAGGAL